MDPGPLQEPQELLTAEPSPALIRPVSSKQMPQDWCCKITIATLSRQQSWVTSIRKRFNFRDAWSDTVYLQSHLLWTPTETFRQIMGSVFPRSHWRAKGQTQVTGGGALINNKQWKEIRIKIPFSRSCPGHGFPTRPANRQLVYVCRHCLHIACRVSSGFLGSRGDAGVSYSCLSTYSLGRNLCFTLLFKEFRIPLKISVNYHIKYSFQTSTVMLS